jgi:hypothetical protein
VNRPADRPDRRRREHEDGASTAWVLAEDREEALEKAEALLGDLDVIPGARPGLYESYLRLRAFARRGRAVDASRSSHGSAVRPLGDRPPTGAGPDEGA